MLSAWSCSAELDPPKNEPTAWPIDEPTATPLTRISLAAEQKIDLAKAGATGAHAAVEAIWPRSPGCLPCWPCGPEDCWAPVGVLTAVLAPRDCC